MLVGQTARCRTHDGYVLGMALPIAYSILEITTGGTEEDPLEAKQEYASKLEKFPSVSEARVVDNKILAAVEDPESQNPELIRALLETGAEVQFVGELRRRLEDVYLELMEAVEGDRHGKN